MRSNIAILLITYNRAQSLKRLFETINKSFFDDEVDLLISIDKSDSDDVEKMAKSFLWEHGEKKIYVHSERQGLKKHIIGCGRFLEEYDALIVLEDDLIVSPSFYLFAKECVKKYKNDDKIAGISLYTHLFNFESNLIFTPTHDENDVFFMQFAQSWGQVWMKKQWNDFYDWFQKHDDDDFSSPLIPSFIGRWPKTSWLKYHIRYLIENDKYFVYPYVAFSSNCSEIGEHARVNSSLWQVPLLQGKKVQYILPDFEQSKIKYDAFMERVGIAILINDIEYEVELDLYGTKKEYRTRFLISSKELNYKIIESYGLDLRPHELNIIRCIPGNFLYLYDLNNPNNNKFKKRKKLQRINYYFRMQLGIKSSFKYLCNAFCDRINFTK